MCAVVTCEPWLTEQFRIGREEVSFEAKALRPLLKATMPFGQELSSCLISPFLYSYKSCPRPFHCGSVTLVWLIQTAMLGKKGLCHLGLCLRSAVFKILSKILSIPRVNLLLLKGNGYTRNTHIKWHVSTSGREGAKIIHSKSRVSHRASLARLRAYLPSTPQASSPLWRASRLTRFLHQGRLQERYSV